MLIATPDSDAPELASESSAREVAANLELLELQAGEGSRQRPPPGAVHGLDRRDHGRGAVLAWRGSRSRIRIPSARRAWPTSGPRSTSRCGGELAREQIADQRAVLQEAIAALPPGSDEQAAALQERLDALSVASIAPTGVRQIDRAKPPADASSPKPVQNTLIGAIVGLALGLALAIALERRDRRVRDPRFMEYVLGGPIIGRIPRSRALARSGRGTRALPAPEAEAFRTVRVNLRRQLEQQGIRSLDRDLGDPGRGEDHPGLEPGPDRGRLGIAGAPGRGRPAPPEPRPQPRGQRRRRPLRPARLRPVPAP